MSKKKKKKIVGETYSKGALKVRTAFFRSKDAIIDTADYCILYYVEEFSEKSCHFFDKKFKEIDSKDCFRLEEVLDMYSFINYINSTAADRICADFSLQFIERLSHLVEKSSSDVASAISKRESVRIAEEVFYRFANQIIRTSFDLLEIILNQMFVDNVDKLFELVYNNIDNVLFALHGEKEEISGLSYQELLHQFLSHFDECTSDILRDKLKELDDVVEEEDFVSINKVSYNYISSYKELNSLATSNGYVYDRSNGDHGIFKNEYGNVVVIPQGRSIGKGLSIVIQKGIKGGDRDV